MSSKRRIVIGITGASGIIYGVRLLEVLKEMDSIETHLIVSKAAERTRDYETQLSAADLKSLADVHYQPADIAAGIASGSYQTAGMIIAPCSVKTLAEIANGLSSNLIARAADVTLKERRKLVLMVRETPFTSIHLENMLRVSQAGGIIAPPVPAFYNNPESLDDMVNHSVGRVLDLFNIDSQLVKRWLDIT